MILDKFIYVKQSAAKNKLYRSQFNRIRPRFLKYICRTGVADELLSLQDLKLLSEGKLPDDYDIHHFVPISGGGTNKFSNLCLIHKDIHDHLNRKYFDPQVLYLNNEDPGYCVEIKIPHLNIVNTKENTFFQE